MSSAKKTLRALSGVSGSRCNPLKSTFVVQTSQDGLGQNSMIARNPVSGESLHRAACRRSWSPAPSAQDSTIPVGYAFAIKERSHGPNYIDRGCSVAHLSNGGRSLGRLTAMPGTSSSERDSSSVTSQGRAKSLNSWIVAHSEMYGPPLRRKRNVRRHYMVCANVYGLCRS